MTNQHEEEEDLLSILQDALEEEEDNRHLRRNTDPDTSHEAAALLTGNAAIAERIRVFVNEYPGHLVGEAADELGLGRSKTLH